MTGARTAARAVALWSLAVVAVVATARVGALAEHCGDASPDTLDRAAAETVGWFERNQLSDGRWLYQFDVSTGDDKGDYNWVRHAGVLMALELAAARQIGAARAVADRGWQAVESQLVRFDDRLALRDGGRPTTGGTSLLVAALTDRRASTRNTADDARLHAFGAYLAGQVEADGLVNEDADPVSGEPTPQSFSKFTTGEAMFALARLERELPGRGYGDTARRIGDYLVIERAVREGYRIDFSEHWGAYGFAELTGLSNPVALSDLERRWVRREMWLAGIQIRYDSQRTNRGVNIVLRGHQAPASGIGTIGEALGAWSRVASRDQGLAGTRGWLHDRLACTVGVLAERQASPEESLRYPNPTMARGAFVYGGLLRMDDQQHALAAILGARDALGQPLPKRTPVPTSGWLVALLAVAAVNPLRLARRLAEQVSVSVGERLVGSGLALLALVVLAVVGGPVLEALSVSVAAALVAAGFVLAAGALVALIVQACRRAPVVIAGRWRALVPVCIPLALAPELLIAALGIGAGGHGEAFVAGLAVAYALAVALSGVVSGAALAAWGAAAVDAAALGLAVLLIAEGIQAI